MQRLFAEDRIAYLETLLSRRNAEFNNLNKAYEKLLEQNKSLEEQILELKKPTPPKRTKKTTPKKKTVVKEEIDARPTNSD